MFDGPFSSYAFEFLRIVHEHASYFCVLRVFGFGRAEERLERKEGGSDGQNRRPGRA